MIVFRSQADKAEIISLLESLMKKAAFPSMTREQHAAVLEHMAHMKLRPDDMNIQIMLATSPELQLSRFQFDVSFKQTQEPRSVQ